MIASLRKLGLPIPAEPGLVELAVAGGLTFGALALGWLVNRWLCQRLTDVLAERTGEHGANLKPRVGAILRNAVSALLLAIVLSAWPWPPLAAFVVGVALAATVALLMRALLRAARLPRWVAALVATLLFVALLSNAVGGLAQVSASLESIGVDVGKRRISLLSVITVLITGVALYAGARLVNRVVGHSISRAGRLDATQKLLAQKLVAIAVIVVAFLIGIDLLGIDLTALAFFSGALGLAVGFGLQKTVGNLFAGLILLMDRSIKPGDVVSVGESFGTVNKIGVRAVSVITRDGKEHLIPNEILMTQEVINWSYSSRDVRVHILVGVGYDSDLRLAQRLMIEAASECPRVLDSPKPLCWLTEFGEWSVKFDIRVWIADPESGIGNIKADVLMRVWDKFREHGITLPYPQRDLHLKSVPEELLRRPE